MEKLECSFLQVLIKNIDTDLEQSAQRKLIISALEDFTDADKRLAGAVTELAKVIQNHAGGFAPSMEIDGSACDVFNEAIKKAALSDKTEKELILIDTLDIDLSEFDDINAETYDDTTISAPDGEYRVLTANEADNAAHEYIRESIWAFNADFIITNSRVLDFDDASRAIISAIQEQCEDGNEALLKLIDSLDDFVDRAVSADGRGHFISGYDGQEIENYYNGEYYYIYRTN